MKISLNIIFLQILIQTITAKDFLVVREWLNAPFIGWGTGKSLKCAGQLIEANKQVLVVGDGQKSVQKQFTSLPDHYSVLVRIDFVIIDDWDNQTIKFYADSQQLSSYTYKLSSIQPELQICGDSDILDRFERVQYMFSHTSDTITIQVDTNGNNYAGLLDLQIFIDTCHINCQKCSGNKENQCLTCKPGAVKSSGQCVCPFGKYMYKGICQDDCTGNLRKNPNGSFCEEIPCKKATCNACDKDNFSCAKCNGRLRVYLGDCVDKCPTYTENIAGVCVDLTKNYWNGMFLFKGFFEDDFSSFSFQDYGFAFNPKPPSESKVPIDNWAQFSDCTDSTVLKRFYGGFGIIGKGVSIEKTWNIVDENNKPIKHSSILIRFYYAQIENYENLKSNILISESESVYINGKQEFSLVGGGTEMGCGRLDQGENFGWIEANSTSTNSTNQIKLVISNNFEDPAWYEGFGLREMMVIVSRCIDNCEECGDYDGCVRCSTNYYLWRAQCYKDMCPEGSYQNTAVKTKNVCNDCHPSCITCSGGAQNECIKCQDPRLFKSGECLLDCGVGFYPEKPACKACNPDCQACNGPENNQCTKCTGSRYLYKLTSSCLLKCPDTFYANTSTNSCDPCSSKCFTCNGPSENQCLTCPSPTRFFWNNKCESQCPPGMYGEKADQTCQLCQSPCQTCQDSPTKCTSCISSLFLSDNICIPTCPNRTYGNLVSQVCEKCHVQCGNCKGPTQTDCLTCDDEDGYFDSTTNQCVSQCPSKYFATKENNLQICKSCDSTCTECKDPGDKFSCTKCSSGRYLTYNNSCDKECPDYYYKDISNYICKNCHPSCLSCINDSSTGCTSCIKGKFFNQNMCLARCPDGTYPDDVKSICLSCHPSCASCDGDLFNQCTRCQLVTNLKNICTLQGKYLQDKTCSEKCKDGYYPNPVSRVCQLCHPTCGTCTEGDESSCLSCKSPLYLSNNQCLSLCPDGKYHNPVTQLCELCPFTCKNCLGVNKDQCLSCSGNRLEIKFVSNRFLVKPGLKCESYCPQGYLPNLKTNECNECHISCKNCSGTGDDQCTECPAGTYLHQNKCQITCPIGFFPTEQPNLCNPCHFSCQTCTGSLESQCESCQGNRFFLPHLCILECPEKYYADKVTNTCQKCDKSCKTCFGVNNNQCNSCYDDKLLLNSSCIDSCPNGYVISLDKSQCLLCGSTCATCQSGQLDYCLSCLDGWYMHANRCFNICPEATYPSSKSEQTINGFIHEILICKNCVENCQMCTGFSIKECQKLYPVAEQKTTDKLIFYIFIGQSSYCLFSFILGFYLDYKATQPKKVKINEKEQTLGEETGRPAITKPQVIDHELENNDQNNMKQSHMLHQQPYDSALLQDINDVSPNGSPTATNLNLDPQYPSPQRSNHKGFSLVRQSTLANKMLRVNGSIKKRSDKEIKDLIAPQGGVGDFMINLPETHSQLEISHLDQQSQLQRSQTKFGQNTINQNQSNMNLMTSNPSLQFLQRKPTLGRLKGFYDPITNTFTQIPEESDKLRYLPDKNCLVFFFIFFEITSLIFYNNKHLLRPLRVLVYYCKILFLLFLTSKMLYIASPAVFAFLIGIQMIMTSIEKIILLLSTNVNKMLAIIFTIFIILILYHVLWFFAPLLKIISFQEDFDWSISYLIVYGADIVALQIIYMCAQYFFTKKYIFKDFLKENRTQKILAFFLYNQKFATWLQEK